MPTTSLRQIVVIKKKELLAKANTFFLKLLHHCKMFSLPKVQQKEKNVINA
jgi:hypothetical protein